jgi:hypothetical protein
MQPLGAMRNGDKKKKKLPSGIITHGRNGSACQSGPVSRYFLFLFSFQKSKGGNGIKVENDFLFPLARV